MIDDTIRQIIREELAIMKQEILEEMKETNVIERKEYGEALDVKEVAKIMKCSVTKVYEMARHPDFPKKNVGSRVIIPTRPFFKWFYGQEK